MTAADLPSQGQLEKLVEVGLQAAGGDQAEVVIIASRNDLTRFAASGIHQSISQADGLVNVRSVLGKKVGVASGNALSEGGVRAVAERARAIAAVQAESPEFESLPGPEPLPTVSAWAEDTAACTAEQRAEAVRQAAEVAGASGLTLAGALSTETSAVCVGNSLGVRAYERRSVARAHLVVSGSDSSGYAEQAATSFSALDLAAMAQRATEKAVLGRHPVRLEPGDYTVILEPAAVAEMLAFLGYFGFSALAYQEGRSFLCERRGEQVAAECITLWDDGTDPRGLPAGFDMEGVPKRKVTLLERGVAQGPVYDSFTAHRGKVRSTGHAALAPNPAGPYPDNLFLAPGDEPLAEIIAGTEKGLLVTRFHYTNVVHPKRLIITGMTRDGTCLIEGGRLTSGVRNLRFDQGILEALARVSAVSAETLLTESGTYAPALRVESFRFASGTEF